MSFAGYDSSKNLAIIYGTDEEFLELPVCIDFTALEGHKKKEVEYAAIRGTVKKLSGILRAGIVVDSLGNELKFRPIVWKGPRCKFYVPEVDGVGDEVLLTGYFNKSNTFAVMDCSKEVNQ